MYVTWPRTPEIPTTTTTQRIPIFYVTWPPTPDPDDIAFIEDPNMLITTSQSFQTTTTKKSEKISTTTSKPPKNDELQPTVDDPWQTTKPPSPENEEINTYLYVLAWGCLFFAVPLVASVYYRACKERRLYLESVEKTRRTAIDLNYLTNVSPETFHAHQLFNSMLHAEPSPTKS